MSVLRSLETKIAGLVEGAFGRAFRSQLDQVELTRRLIREMDEHRTTSRGLTYVPNEFVVWLGPQDHATYTGLGRAVIEELGADLLEHARSEGLTLVARPRIDFRAGDELALGDCGIQALLVPAEGQDPAPGASPSPSPSPPGAQPPPPPPAPARDSGRTMVYSEAERLRAPLEAARPRNRLVVVVEGKRMPVGAGGAVIGRSRDCDVVMASTDVSRRHAMIAATIDGWVIADLGSTNGVRVNGHRIRREEPIHAGDTIDLGAARLTIEVD